MRERGGVKLQAASEDTASSSEQTACRHGNAAPNLQVTVRGAGSKQRLGRKGGRKQRGRDAGAVNAADKESQLYPHALMLLMLYNI